MSKTKKKSRKSPEDTDKVLLDLESAGLPCIVNAITRGARLVKEGRSVLLELSPMLGRRMGLQRHERIRIGETKDEIAKVKVGPSDSRMTELGTEDMLPRLRKIEETLREMQAQKTRVRFEVE